MTARARAAIGLAWLLAVAALLALGTWQVQRRAWKLDLIAKVEARIHAPPVPAPRTATGDDAYLRVVARGTYLACSNTFVQASTIRGPGWWVLTPLRETTGITVLINRGFMPTRTAPPPPGPVTVTVTGLLRVSEPGGGFLRSNDPARDRWYSRDVTAIAAKRGVAPVAPYFIDADASPNAPGQPVGGLTVVQFANSHLVYAITWYTLAIMAAAGFLYWLRLTHAEDAA
ncbi:SURF1 family protein [Sphingomonas sp. Tas61C01]|uniref:SURF1 family protein n=1 Tax=Sphingomonas sp. Tas61C01 TaxID=3458297 RepID=UPI00403EE1AA